MKLKDLDFEFPEELIANEPQRPSRVMYVNSSGSPEEISISRLKEKFRSGDVLIINETKVSNRRVFGQALLKSQAASQNIASDDQKGKKQHPTGSLKAEVKPTSVENAEEFEVLFVKKVSSQIWEVLCPAKKIGARTLALPGSVTARIIQTGRPQLMELSQEIDETYFEHNGEVPLPPYIRKNLKDQHSRQEDRSWYQPHWAKNIGSTASPTASLHFTLQDLDELRQKGVQIVPVTLHVGLGTYLPVDKENLLDFQMHGEEVSVSKNSWDQILSAKKTGGKIWCLGTTSTRAVESVACGLVKPNNLGFQGETQLKILPGFEFQIVDILLTNFHQPKTTLLAMVSAFSSLENLKENYKWAIERKFRLFSYGDLSVWERSKSVL